MSNKRAVQIAPRNAERRLRAEPPDCTRRLCDRWKVVNPMSIAHSVNDTTTPHQLTNHCEAAPRDTVLTFLTHLLRDQSHGTLFLAGGPRSADGKIYPWRDTPYDLARTPLPDIAAAAVHRAEREECYFSAALFTGTRRVEPHAETFCFLYSDLDTGVVPADVPPPTILLSSSPGRHQAFWRLDIPTDRSTATNLNHRLAIVCHADMSGWDATQVLRLPGLRNWKYPDAISHIAHFDDVSYRLPAFAHLPRLPNRVAAARTTLDVEPYPIAAEAIWAWAYPRLSPRMMRVANGDDTDYENDASRGDAALILALRGCGLMDREVAGAFIASPRGVALAERKHPSRLMYLIRRTLDNSRARIGEIVSI